MIDKIGLAVSLSVVALMCILRIPHIDSDFPKMYTDGAFVETDEGWYCNGATSKIITGGWIGEGFQSMPAIPVNHLVQYAAMSVFGVSIYTARYSAVIFFFVLIISIYFTNKKLFGRGPSAVSLLPIACSSFLFAYSRIALIDIEMLAFASLSFLFAAYKKNMFASVFMVVAVLTKTSAVCFVVPLAIMIFIYSKKQSYFSLAVIFISLATFYFVSNSASGGLVESFFKTNISGRSGNGFASVFYNAVKFDPATIILASSVAVFSIRDIHRWVFLPMLVFCIAMISLNTYQPMRYFTILYIPASMVIAAGVKNIDFKKSCFVVMLASVLLNIGTVYGMMSNRTFSFKNELNNFNCESVSGRMANTVTLWTGIPSLKNGKCIVGNR